MFVMKIKKKMGIVLDEHGNVVKKDDEKEDENIKELPQSTKDGKVYNSIKDYKPTRDYTGRTSFDKLENKLNK